MALPMVLSMLVNSLYNIVDSFFVARISEQAMTALSLVYPVQNLINAIAIGFGVGTIPRYLSIWVQRIWRMQTGRLPTACSSESYTVWL